MKAVKLFVVGQMALLLAVVSSHAQLALNFGPTLGSTIQFNGSSSSFGFSPATGPQWYISSENGGTGSAMNLLGTFTDGPFNYGPITTNGLISGLDYQVATVTGPTGTFNINDGAGYLLTGNIDWVQLSTANKSGSINGALDVNVTGLSYSGSNPDLLAIAENGPGSMSLTFQFSPGETLGQLTSGTGPYNTSFSGSLSVPEPSDLCFLVAGGGLLAGAWMIGKRRQAMSRNRA